MLHIKVIIVIDGECNFCNANAQFIKKRQLQDNIQIITSQSYEGENLLNKYNMLGAQSIILLEDEIVYTKFRAIVNIAKYLSLPYILQMIIRHTPIGLGNFVYDIVAKYRYVFGKRSVPKCDC